VPVLTREGEVCYEEIASGGASAAISRSDLSYVRTNKQRYTGWDCFRRNKRLIPHVLPRGFSFTTDLSEASLKGLLMPYHFSGRGSGSFRRKRRQPIITDVILSAVPPSIRLRTRMSQTGR
jgi:hypothetical protein